MSGISENLLLSLQYSDDRSSRAYATYHPGRTRPTEEQIAAARAEARRVAALFAAADESAYGEPQ
jgi:hypothetical protein